MGKANFSDDFKPDAMLQTTERGYPIAGGSVRFTPDSDTAEDSRAKVVAFFVQHLNK